MIQSAIIASIVAITSWLASFGSRWLAIKTQAIAQPSGGRRLHERPVPQLGGLGIGLTIFVACAFALAGNWFAPSVKPLQLIGLMVGIGLLMLGGYLDDKYELKPGWTAMFALLAALAVVLTGSDIHAITNPFGRPFIIAWPWAPLLTIGWLLAITAATKFADGLDGLVTGQTVIGAGVIAALTLSPSFYQPAMTGLCLVVAAAFLGFLPANFNPAKQFLGESGSTIAGFALGFLAVASGAKVATALMAVGLPLADILFVMANRVRQGRSPFKGDRSHLHFRLMDLGLSQRQAVYLLWTISLLFGLVALGFQTRGKVVLLVGLIIVTLALPWILGLVASRKKACPSV